MTDPISLAAGLLALVTFAFGACQSLVQEIQSFEDQPKDIWHLKGELESLSAILKSLFSVIPKSDAESDADLLSLKPPLLGCGEACKDLRDLVRECTKHSDGKKSSFRDWTMLKRRADRIKRVQSLLSTYRSTINLALANATLRTSRTTNQVLDQYNNIVLETTSRLNEHMRQVDGRLYSLPLEGISTVNEKEEVAQALREKFRVKQCLDICRQVAHSINRGRSAVVVDGASPARNTRYTRTETVDTTLTADETTIKFLNDLSLNTEEACASLEQRGRFVQGMLKRFPNEVIKEFDETFAECYKRQNQKDLLIGCLSVCETASRRSEEARTNVFEDIHAAERAKQAIISNVGDLISAKGIRADVDSEQILGQTTYSPFVNSRDQGGRRKPTEGSSSGSSNDTNEVYQSRNCNFPGISPIFYELKNLLFIFLFAMLLRNV